MRIVAVTAGLIAFAIVGGAQAQPLPAPSAPGPYQIVQAQAGQLFLLAIGSRVRSGKTATITLLSLDDAPDSQRPARVDISIEFDCERRASRNGVMAARDLQGTLQRTMMSKSLAWTTSGPGKVDQTLLKFACDGVYAGPTAPSAEGIGKAWRERPR